MFGGHDNDGQAMQDNTAAAPTDNTMMPGGVAIPEPATAPGAPMPRNDAGFGDTSYPATNDIAGGPSMNTPAEPAAATAVTPDDLIEIKQQALQQLSPLVGHLDQTPEDKFRTTMMMIQASDNQALIKDAYAAAQAISDEKARAQALLDIVNEINYFTQAKSAGTPAA